jgi:small-conductance mechanosensitive channel
MSLIQLASPVAVERWDPRALVLDWRLDAMTFLRHDLPKIIFIICVSFILVRVLRIFTERLATLQARRLPPGLRTQQIKTVAGVINSVAVFVIVFVAVLMILAELNLHLEPLLASAGVAGLAIGFGAQSLVHDFINGFYILLENQYDIGDSIKIAGVKGSVEEMTLRHTVLRDDDGTLHTVPNSAIQIVSNMTRDWSQLTLRVTAAYGESSDKVVALLGEIGTEVRHDPAYADDIVSDIQVPGIDKVSNGEVEYLMIVKTKPNRQYGVSRELRRRIKDRFHKENIQTVGPGKVYVVDQSASAS